MVERSAEQDQDDGVTAQKHLANEAILVNTLTLASLGLLGPHFLYVLQNHVAVSVKGLNASQ